jgi:hypothetical protein
VFVEVLAGGNSSRRIRCGKLGAVPEKMGKNPFSRARRRSGIGIATANPGHTDGLLPQAHTS